MFYYLPSETGIKHYVPSSYYVQFRGHSEQEAYLLVYLRINIENPTVDSNSLREKRCFITELGR